MSADILRKAASLMRERAEAATASPWIATAVDGLPIVFDTAAIPEPVVYDQELKTGDAEHIASWHPAVALAVADLLDREAAVIGARDASDISPLAHAVATAYLNEEQPA